MRARLTLIAMMLAGCSSLDLTQPIALVPEGWATSEIEALASAAQCWNLQFGTELQVSESPTTVQQVGVSYSDFVCLYARGVTEPNLPVHVYLCPPRYASSSAEVQDRILFLLALHELGHVVNIRYHSDQPDAVMAGGEDNDSETVPAGFTLDDQRLFREANPSFSPSPPATCSAVVVDHRHAPPWRCACAP